MLIHILCLFKYIQILFFLQQNTKSNLDGGGLCGGDNPSSVRSALDISGGPRSLQGAGLGGAGIPADSDMDFMSPAGWYRALDLGDFGLIYLIILV